MLSQKQLRYYKINS